jgi:hypothetical protein
MAQKITHLDVGDVWVPQATFSVASVNTDPTNLTVSQQDAAGVETVLLNNVLVSTLTGGSTPVAKTATGIFKLNPGISLTASGYWFVKFTGTGAAAGTEQQEVIVDPDEFSSDAGVNARSLVGLSETKDWLRVQNVDTSNDLQIVRAINDISDRFYEECEREIKLFTGANPQARTFDVDEQAIYRRTIRVGDLTSFTQVRILDELGNLIQTPSLSDCISLPRVRRSWEPIRALRFTQNVSRLWAGYYPLVIEVTGVWGFPAVPGNLRQAVLDAVVSTLDRDVENYKEDLAAGVSGGSAGKDDALPGSAMDVALSYRDELIG